MNLDEEILDVLCAVFGEDYREDITSDTGPDDLETWDSLSAMRVLLALERSFGVRISIDEAAEMTTVGRIQEVIHSEFHTNGTRSYHDHFFRLRG